MGYLTGDRVAWQRWLYPSGERIPTDGGYLLDPAGPFGVATPRVATHLAAADQRVLVVQGDSGTGKSFMLQAERDRLKAGGVNARLFDLSVSDPEGLRQAIRTTCNAGPAVLLFEGFEEALGPIAGAIGQSLEDAEGRVERLIFAVRPGIWIHRLVKSLPDWASNVAQLLVAPLTVDQVREAVATELPDPQAFLDEVDAAGIGHFAAHPMSLSLLLQLAKTNSKLPATRRELFEHGVAALLYEERDGQAVDPPIEARKAAAQRLAAASVLTGQPRIGHRRAPRLDDHQQVFLDDVAATADGLSAMDAVYRSPVLRGTGTSRTWAHRSIAEFLCAGALGGLPHRAATQLLEQPHYPDALRPQFLGVAAFLADTDPQWYSQLLDQRFEALFNPDLAQRTPAQRRQLAGALIQRLLDDDMPLEVPDRDDEGPRFGRSLFYRGLAYDELADDLAPLLDPDRPTWVRREAMLVILDNEIDAFDAHLIDLTETIAAQYAPNDYGPEVQLAIYATIAIHDMLTPTIRDRAIAVLHNGDAPWSLRNNLARRLWPDAITTAELDAAVHPKDRELGGGAFGRYLVRMLTDRVTTGKTADPAILAFFASSPSSTLQARSTPQVAASLLPDFITSTTPGSAPWRAVTGLVYDWMIFQPGQFAPDRTAIAAVPSAHRARFAHDVLHTGGGHDGIDQATSLGLLHPDDLGWWLEALHAATTAEPPMATAAHAVLAALARSAAKDGTYAAVRHAAQAYAADHPDVSGEVAAAFPEAPNDLLQAEPAAGPIVVDGVTLHPVEDNPDDTDPFAKAEQERHDRLRTALAGDDTAAVLDALSEDPLYIETDKVTWERTPPDLRGPAVERCLHFLCAGHVDVHDKAAFARLVVAHRIVTWAAPARLAEVAPERWLDWLPTALGTVHGGSLAVDALARRGTTDAARADAAMIAALSDKVAINYLTGHETPAVSSAALGLASPDNLDADPNQHHLHNLLLRAAAHRPGEAAELAIHHIVQRPGAGTADRTQQIAYHRAVEAARALIGMTQLPVVFGQLLAAFRSDQEFAESVLARAGASADAWRALTPGQLGELYLWADGALPAQPWHAPGVIVTSSPPDIREQVLTRLTAPGTSDAMQSDVTQAESAAAVLDALAVTTKEIWLRLRARQIRDVIADIGPSASVAAVLQVLDDPKRRAITTAEQLLDLIVDTLRTLADELRRDRAFRSQAWHRQRVNDRYAGWVPRDERELSDWLSRQLRWRLAGKVAFVREPEVQPRLGNIMKDIPDLIAVSLDADHGLIEVIIEVKCNWNDHVATDIRTQLGERYLEGPHGSVGVYLVGMFRGTSWPTSDSRRAKAMRNPRAKLAPLLEREAAALREKGAYVLVELLDLPLDATPDDPAPGKPRPIRRRPPDSRSTAP